MIVAVTAQGGKLDSKVDPRFGRSPWFVLIDTETGEVESIRNDKNVQAAQGAGVQSAQLMVDKKVSALLTGHCGPNAFQVLSAAKIKVYSGAEGTVSEALEKFKSNELVESTGADVGGHW